MVELEWAAVLYDLQRGKGVDRDALISALRHAETAPPREVLVYLADVLEKKRKLAKPRRDPTVELDLLYRVERRIEQYRSGGKTRDKALEDMARELKTTQGALDKCLTRLKAIYRPKKRKLQTKRR